MDTLREHARALAAEARRADERRLLVCAGAREPTYDAASAALDAADVDPADAVVLSDADTGVDAEHVPLARSGRLLGETHRAVVLDCQDACRPNPLGRAVGTVDGGGLLVLACPPLDGWPDRRDGFGERLAAPPFGADEVTGHFRERLVATLRAHRGIAVWDADAGRLEREGTTDPAPRRPRPDPEPPADHAFPDAAYDACLTRDQTDAVAALERLREDDLVVVESDRGRGKSSAAGLAAAALAAEGRDVLVTAPEFRNAAELFTRARELLGALDALAGEDDHELRATGGGRVRFERPSDAVDAPADCLLVDEAAALPVALLESLAERGLPAAFTTTVHGYEGAGRGFDVRFRGALRERDRGVTDVRLTEPVRYAAGDPVEAWAFRALLLDARPPVDPLVAGAEPDDCAYRRLDAPGLLDREHRLREAFGLLVAAHYRTEPDDLARLLDAPNVTVRGLLYDGRVVAVALLAWEGDLPAATREAMYEGERVRGNMLPDVLTSQLRDPEAGAPSSVRVLRIAVHDAARERGLGSRLLREVRAEFDGGDGPPTLGDDGPDAVARRRDGDSLDYLGVGFGATPGLVRFWRTNGYRTVHLSTSRNERSGEYSALLMAPLTDAGRALADRSAAWFRRRVGDVLVDALDDCDPDVVRATLAACERAPDPDVTDREWRVVAAAAYGPGLYDPAPGPFRRLALAELCDPSGALDADAERLLVRKALQARDWDDVADELGYVSRRECMQAFGDACRPLVDRFGGETAREEVARFR